MSKAEDGTLFLDPLSLLPVLHQAVRELGEDAAQQRLAIAALLGEWQNLQEEQLQQEGRRAVLRGSTGPGSMGPAYGGGLATVPSQPPPGPGVEVSLEAASMVQGQTAVAVAKLLGEKLVETNPGALQQYSVRLSRAQAPCCSALR